MKKLPKRWLDSWQQLELFLICSSSSGGITCTHAEKIELAGIINDILLDERIGRWRWFGIWAHGAALADWVGGVWSR
jgi:hypothetical protein